MTVYFPGWCDVVHVNLYKQKSWASVYVATGSTGRVHTAPNSLSDRDHHQWDGTGLSVANATGERFVGIYAPLYSRLLSCNAEWECSTLVKESWVEEFGKSWSVFSVRNRVTVVLWMCSIRKWEYQGCYSNSVSAETAKTSLRTQQRGWRTASRVSDDQSSSNSRPHSFGIDTCTITALNNHQWCSPAHLVLCVAFCSHLIFE